LVIWSDPAKKDLRQIFDYISKDSIHYAREVIDELITKTDDLEEFPNMGRMVPEIKDTSIREIVIYSYRIIYHVSDNIEILAIIHGRQDFRI
jgi:addiction module RelE/StbE family toxin